MSIASKLSAFALCLAIPFAQAAEDRNIPTVHNILDSYKLCPATSNSGSIIAGKLLPLHIYPQEGYTDEQVWQAIHEHQAFLMGALDKLRRGNKLPRTSIDKHVLIERINLRMEVLAQRFREKTGIAVQIQAEPRRMKNTFCP